MGSETLSPLDVSFLSLERPETPMHLGAVAVFTPRGNPWDVDPDRDPQRLVDLVVRRAGRVPQLRRVVSPAWVPPGGARWVEDPAFDPARQVRHHRVPAPGGRGELAAAASEVISHPLDLNRPPWEIHLLTGLTDGAFGLLLKIHHALADGLQAAEIGAALLDGGSPANGHPPQPTDTRAAAALASAARWARTTANPLTAAAEMQRLTRHSAGWAAATGRGVAATLRGALTATMHTTLTPAPASPLNADLGPARQVATARVDLDDIRRTRKHHGGTTNDVLLAIVTGALRSWLTASGHDVDDLPLRALVPTSQPPSHRRGTGANRLSGYLVDLPVNESDPATRLTRISAAMAHNKAAGPTAGPGAIPQLADLVPPAVHRIATPMISRHASRLFNTIVTQVPIPDLGFTLAGAELDHVFPIVPLAPGQSLGFAVTTYRGTAHFGINTHPATLPDPRQLATQIPAALSELLTSHPHTHHHPDP